ncbi:DNA mismatch repair protein MutL [Buchnera aphidicola str. Bp (Baizongia pistaciae)]|uniref:DNA mismatch repair protein MutL n=1 Tax=Buchnera aphidicola subsp. Baizongia pistaciae (strain Bp) TaxID=224915 RepID=MUTL_BUCBP|nr:DNA mismatch repair endonuclease MutL [Buchnera aphidicola]Q89A38.1 RecName: Full=DNA mismatch repair protein MutL [Buchnera aphidicola str. Bp (Baizongia pistaciae)]AAO27218.1 DNA mismatch repair protein MutL [Buchnera aphidicola str. Bp (Baizongia pistaciae)]
MFIKILPLSTSSYISAGEVICNPASVVKELMENSIDSSATCIHIEIKKGGLQSIVVKDNGCGIDKSDLKASLLHHATSKIYSVCDLNNITTLGFRGEALASISAVSRIILSSCNISSKKVGWSIYSDGFGVISVPKLVVHNKGTICTVLDLFFNRPVRQKTIKSEYSEFLRIDEIVRSLSLSNNKLSVSLRHNDKLIRYYDNCNIDFCNINMLNAIYGLSSVIKVVPVDYFLNTMKITGWLYLLGSYHTSKKKFQYFYINGRIILNRSVHHAVYQAVSEINHYQYSVSYILYLKLNCNELDVNIHPAKKIIKIINIRLIHVFICQAILYSLKKECILKKDCTKIIKNISNNKKKNNLNYNFQSNLDITSCIVQENSYSIPQKLFNLDNVSIIETELKFKRFKCKDYLNTIFGNVLMVIKNFYLLIEKNDELFLFFLPRAKSLICELKLKFGVKNGLLIKKLRKKYFYFFKNNTEYHFFLRFYEILSHVGLNFNITLKYAELNSIPFMIDDTNLGIIISEILYFFKIKREMSLSRLVTTIMNHSKILVKYWDHLQVLSVISECEKYYKSILELNVISYILQPINFDSTVNFFKNDSKV